MVRARFHHWRSWLYNEYVNGRKLPSDYKNFNAAQELAAWLSSHQNENKIQIFDNYSVPLNVGSIAAQNKEIKQVEAAVEGLRLAMIHPTTASLDQYVMDELSYGHSGGKIEDKETFEANLLNGNSDFWTSLSNQTIKIYKNSNRKTQFVCKTHDKGKEEGE